MGGAGEGARLGGGCREGSWVPGRAAVAEGGPAPTRPRPPGLNGLRGAAANGGWDRHRCAGVGAQTLGDILSTAWEGEAAGALADLGLEEPSRGAGGGGREIGRALPCRPPSCHSQLGRRSCPLRS